MHQPLQPFDLPQLVLRHVQLLQQRDVLRETRHSLADRVEGKVQHAQVSQAVDVCQNLDVVVVELDFLERDEVLCTPPMCEMRRDRRISVCRRGEYE